MITLQRNHRRATNDCREFRRRLQQAWDEHEVPEFDEDDPHLGHCDSCRRLAHGYELLQEAIDAHRSRFPTSGNEASNDSIPRWVRPVLLATAHVATFVVGLVLLLATLAACGLRVEVAAIVAQGLRVLLVGVLRPSLGFWVALTVAGGVTGLLYRLAWMAKAGTASRRRSGGKSVSPARRTG